MHKLSGCGTWQPVPATQFYATAACNATLIPHFWHVVGHYCVMLTKAEDQKN